MSEPKRPFYVATRANTAPQITCGEWSAHCQHTVDMHNRPKWRMVAEFSGSAEHVKFHSEYHPEGKYPLTTEEPTPLLLATFLEECQRVLAERDAGG